MPSAQGKQSVVFLRAVEEFMRSFVLLSVSINILKVTLVVVFCSGPSMLISLPE